MTEPSAKGWVALVNEDDPSTRSFMATTLREHGFEVLEENSAEAATDHIADRPDIDLLITDIRLAGEFSGLDLAHWVTQNRPSIRVLAVSGFPKSLVSSSRPDLYDFLKTPFSPALLISKAMSLLDPHKTRH